MRMLIKSLTRVILYFNTIKYLRPVQVYYFVLNILRNRALKKLRFTPAKSGAFQVDRLILIEPLVVDSLYYKGGSEFCFLNRTVDFGDTINWEYGEYKKLWTYHLNYFDFLNQEDISKEKGLELINSFLINQQLSKVGMEPYCISLRGIQWIKFICKHSINDENINQSLYAQYRLLIGNLEYHLLANHLLENAFSLLFAAYYFNDKRFYCKAHRLIRTELAEQILPDGGHYERSPMYHLIILNRLLDVVNLVRANKHKFNDQPFEDILTLKASGMLNWLYTMAYHDKLPAFQDSSNTIPYPLDRLFDYAFRLGFRKEEVRLKESFYRVFRGVSFTAFVDLGSVSPNYQPGHSHAGIFSFVMFCEGKPVIVDPGVSTYERCVQRRVERSTAYHNTVVIQDRDQSQLWGAFRVAKRASVSVEVDAVSEIRAVHDGYRSLANSYHTRGFRVDDNTYRIEDKISNGEVLAHSVLHFHPERKVKLEGTALLIDDVIAIQLEGFQDIVLEDYFYADDFNKLRKAVKLIGSFVEKSKISVNRLFT